MASLLEKLKQLETQFENDNQSVPGNIVEWSSLAKEAKLYTHLLKFDGMIMFLDKLNNELDNLDKDLVNNRKLTDSERQYIFGQKDEKQAIIDFFINKEKFLNDLEEKVNKELEN